MFAVCCCCARRKFAYWSWCCLQKLPQFLQALVELLLAAGIFPPEQTPQHVLINSYGKSAGIPAHTDGPLYSPCVATITLGGPALMAFHKAFPDGTPGDLVSEVCTSFGFCLASETFGHAGSPFLTPF